MNFCVLRSAPGGPLLSIGVSVPVHLTPRRPESNGLTRTLRQREALFFSGSAHNVLSMDASPNGTRDARRIGQSEVSDNISQVNGVSMPEAMKWRDGVKVVRAKSLDALMHGPSGTGRATAFDFAGAGSQQTWIGRVTLK